MGRVVRERAWAGSAIVLGMLFAGAPGCTIDDEGARDAAAPEGDAGPVGAPDAGGRRDAAVCRSRCGTVCCEGGECLGGTECLDRCEGPRCGDDETCCGADELCVGGQCFAPSTECATHADCEGGQVCEPAVDLCVPLPDGATCRHVPTPGAFVPVVEWERDIGQVASLPLVARMDDDDGDGAVGSTDTPDVVAIAYAGIRSIDTPATSGRVYVLSGDDGAVIGESPEGMVFVPWASPALADVDADGRPEVFALIATQPTCDYFIGRCHDDAFCAPVGAEFHCSEEHTPPGETGGVCCTSGPGVIYTVPFGIRVVALGFDAATGNPIGRALWTSANDLSLSLTALLVADLLGDGAPEVLVSDAAYDARTGARVWRNGLFVPGRDRAPEGTHPQRYSDLPFVMDLVPDDDDRPEGYRSDSSVDAAGARRWLSTAVPRGSAAPGELFAAHPGPEVFVINGYHAALLDPATGAVIVDPVSGAPVTYRHAEDDGVPDGAQAGAPVVADFDGDGNVEAGVYTQTGIHVFDFDHDVLHPIRWSYGSATDFGSTSMAVFDFDADGRVEILVMADGGLLMLGIGAPGTLDLKWSDDVRTDTVYQYPVVADVDGDGNAEIVLPTLAGIRVYGDSLDNWVPTRGILNQHAYSIDNVADDASIPRVPVSSVATHGTFRLQRLVDPEAITLAPDLVVDALSSDTISCPLSSTVFVRVRNQGAQGVRAGVAVAIVAGPPGGGGATIGQGVTTRPLLSGQAAWVTVTLADPPFAEGSTDLVVHATVDPPTEGLDAHSECDEANNGSSAFTLVCPELI